MLQAASVTPPHMRHRPLMTTTRLLSSPQHVLEGETADEYSGTLEDGRRAIVVVSRGSEPRTVITVMLARGE